MYQTYDGSFRLPKPPCAPRAITMGKKKHFTGSFVTGDDEGFALQFESHTEKQVALVMLARRDVVHLENQVPMAWRDRAGKGRTHFFDFRVSMRDGTRILMIVKNSKKAADPEFRMDVRCLASRVRPDVGDRVTLITERDLNPIEVHNAQLIHSVRQPDPEPDAAVRRVIAGTSGPVKISDVVDASGWPGRGFRSVVRLIRTHEIELAEYRRIEPESLVRRRLN